MKFLLQFARAWDRFFFAPTSTLPIGVFRAFFGALALLMYSIRAVNWRFYFTDEGYLPAAHALEVLPAFHQPLFHWYPHSVGMTLAFQIVMLISLVCLTLGIFGRVSALVTFLLHCAFIQRNYTIGYGADFVATFAFFSLIFMDNSRSFSLTSWWSRRCGRAMKPQGEVASIVSTMGMRLIQIQLCLIYSYTGMEKLKGAPWWDGTAVWSVIGNTQLMLFDLSWLKNFPMAIAAMTFATLFFEVYFPAIVWYRPVRKWALLFGVGLHLGITFTIGLFFFSFVMIAVYLLFLDEGDYIDFADFFRGKYTHRASAGR
ncbi:MAG: HTTM domain-containing protein [Bdellovibrionota bacterium]